MTSPSHDSRDDCRNWLAAQQAAAEAEARLNRRLAEYLQGRGARPALRDFLEVRFLRNHAVELLEHALAEHERLPPAPRAAVLQSAIAAPPRASPGCQ